MNNSIFILKVNKEPIEFNINDKVRVLKFRATLGFFIRGEKKCNNNFNLFFFNYKKTNNMILCRKGDYLLVEGFIKNKNNYFTIGKLKIFALKIHFLF